MRCSAALVNAIGALALGLTGCGGCGDNDHLAADAGLPPGPFDELPLAEDLTFDGLDGPVHVARDRYGVAHIDATTLADLAFVEGYVMAHDRLPQMDILRRFGSGRLAELFGGLDSGVIATDLEMRVHRMRPLAQQSLDQLRASSTAEDRELVTVLDRFADGVNAYAQDLKNDKWTVDPAIRAGSFDPERFVDWDPVDSLVLGRFQAFSLSYTAPIEVDITDVYQGLRDTFDNAAATSPEHYARRGISKDIVRLAPVGRRPTIDGFPNVDVDTGTRSDAGRPASARTAAAATTTQTTQMTKTMAKRPHVPRDLLARAHEFFRAKMLNGPHALMAPKAGSNNWVVADEVAGGKTLIAGDQHLDLPNPSVFYPVHLIVPGKLDAEGITFPGIPGIVLGHNGKVAWSATVNYHDVNDVYLETLVTCGGGLCAQRASGDPVPVETWSEDIDVGVLGTIMETRHVTYQRVPGHGPIIPTISDGTVVAAGAGEALSVQYTGYDPTFEIRATYGLTLAASVDDGFRALAEFSYGGQNWVLIDNQGNIGWTTHAKVPLRTAAEYTWDPIDNPDGLAPFMVLPGDGSVGWEGWMSSRYIPHAINPAQNYLATANSDPVGQSFDGRPFNGPVVDGRPLWVGATYAAGVRSERIMNLLDQTIAAGPMTLDGMAAIQTDSSSTMGAKLRDAITTALAALDDATAQPADVVGFVTGLSAGDRQALQDARARLAAWSFATPPANDATDPAVITDSVATTIFNAWMHFFIENVFADELAAIGWDVHAVNENMIARSVYGVLVEPSTFVQDAGTSQPVVCDELGVATPEGSCTKQILKSLLDAVTALAAPERFGTTDQSTWRWGELHRLTLAPLFPNRALQLPPDGAPGFPRAGDMFVINRADCGWTDLDFAQSADGPAQRFLAEAEINGTMKLRWALPGGSIYDRSSPHYRDLLDAYYLTNTYFDAPYSIAEILAAGEDRWVFH